MTSATDINQQNHPSTKTSNRTPHNPEQDHEKPSQTYGTDFRHAVEFSRNRRTPLTASQPIPGQLSKPNHSPHRPSSLVRGRQACTAEPWSPCRCGPGPSGSDSYRCCPVLRERGRRYEARRPASNSGSRGAGHTGRGPEPAHRAPEHRLPGPGHLCLCPPPGSVRSRCGRCARRRPCPSCRAAARGTGRAASRPLTARPPRRSPCGC